MVSVLGYRLTVASSSHGMQKKKEKRKKKVSFAIVCFYTVSLALAVHQTGNTEPNKSGNTE